MARIRFSETENIKNKKKGKKIFILLLILSFIFFMAKFKISNKEEKVPQPEIVHTPEIKEELVKANMTEQKPIKKREDLLAQINEITSKTSGTYGVYIKELAQKEGFGINEEMSFPAASTVKVPLLIALYKEIDKGKISKEQLVTYTKNDYEEGTGSLQYTPIGGKWKISEIAKKMMKQSDNVSKNILFRILGFRNVQDYITKLGAKNTDMSLENTTTPKDAAFLLELIYKNKTASAELSSEMLDLMTDTDFEKRLPRYINGVKVSHKIGTWAGAISDVGIVYAESPYIITVYSNKITNVEDAEKTIGLISKAVYDFYSK